MQENDDSENNNTETFSKDTVVSANKSQSHAQADTNIIARLFQGQLRSTVTCPSCSKESVKVESFLTLPLHIPEEYRVPVYVTVVQTCPYESALVKVAFRMKDGETLQDLRISLAKQVKIEPDQVSRLCFFKGSG